MMTSRRVSSSWWARSQPTASPSSASSTRLAKIAFGEHLAMGLSATEAYAKAGLSRLAANGSIKARIAELVGAAAEKAGVTIDRLVAELAKIAFSDIGRALTWGMAENREEGKPPIQYLTLKESSELDVDTRQPPRP
jgi:phage terminase small subunit